MSYEVKEGWGVSVIEGQGEGSREEGLLNGESSGLYGSPLRSSIHRIGPRVKFPFIELQMCPWRKKFRP